MFENDQYEVTYPWNPEYEVTYPYPPKYEITENCDYCGALLVKQEHIWQAGDNIFCEHCAKKLDQILKEMEFEFSGTR